MIAGIPGAGRDGGAFALPPAVRGIRAAFVFFTRLPLGGYPYGTEDFSWAIAHGPLVGAVVGGVTGALLVALQPLGTAGAAVLAVSAMVVLTGGLHEDGLADTADALGGGTTRERILEILKDSRIGTYGAAALFTSLAARCALLVRLEGSALWALPLAGCLARVVPAWLVTLLPYAGPRETSKTIEIVRGSALRAAVATAWGAAALLALVGLHRCSFGRAAILALVIASAAILAARISRRRLGGVTGDLLGAAEQLAEIVALAALAWRT